MGQRLGEAQRIPCGPAARRNTKGEGVQRGQLAAAQLLPLPVRAAAGSGQAVERAGGGLAALGPLAHQAPTPLGAARGLASALDGRRRGPESAVEPGQVGRLGRGGVQREGRGPVGTGLEGQGGVGFGRYSLAAQRRQMKAGRGRGAALRLGLLGLHTGRNKNIGLTWVRPSDTFRASLHSDSFMDLYI